MRRRNLHGVRHCESGALPVSLPARALMLALRDLTRSGEAGRLRAGAGISQGDMARGLGIDQSVLCAFEHGRHLPQQLTVAAGYLRVLKGLANHDAVTRELDGEQKAA